jgi:methionyl-tRNA formyltransferase
MSIVIPAPQGAMRLQVANEKNLRIVFLGTPKFSVHALRALMNTGWPIAAVVTAPDRPVGRRAVMTPSPVKAAAQGLGLTIYTPGTLKDEVFARQFQELRPDLCVVVAYNKIIPATYLQTPRLGFLNIHPSLLPLYRGPSPVRSAILDGCAGTGISIMLLDADVDHGPIVAQEAWTIPQGTDAAFCEDELFRLGAELLTKTLSEYVGGHIIPQPQDHAQATFTHKFTRTDGRLDWTQPAERINDRIRALGDNPGTWTTWDDKSLNIFFTHVIAQTFPARPPGTVFLHEGHLAVACGSHALALEELQLEGGTRQSARDFRNGHASFVDAVLA